VIHLNNGFVARPNIYGGQGAILKYGT